MNSAGDRPTVAQLAHRFTIRLLTLVLVVSSLSIISLPSASALSAGSGNCTQTYTMTGSGTLVVTESGGYCYLAFKNTGAVNTQTSFSWTRPTGLNSVDVLVVGGGGSGGARHGGGGGGGGFVQTDAFAVSSASSISIAVGAGGGASNSYVGTVGQASSFKSSANGLTALGGGFGANNPTAGSGGSGGGAGSRQTPGGVTAQTQTTFSGATITGISFGNKGSVGAEDTNVGGDNNDYWAGGGGGGAGGAGETPTASGSFKTVFDYNSSANAIAGKGGIGRSVSWITTTIASALTIGQTASSTVYFAGGGGGGMGADGQAGGPGGLGGGATGSRIEASGNAGTEFTGGGGGGSGFDDINKSGSTSTVDAANAGAGGSGIVALRYQVRQSAPTITGITGGNGSLSVAFTPAADGIAVTGYKFSTDGGSTWSASTGSTSSPISITGLTNGTTYAVQIRSVSAYWDGVATASTSALAGAACSPASQTTGGYTVLTFTNTATCYWAVPAGVTTADVLVVGGGGGGAGVLTTSNNDAGGGGGGGGVLSATAISLPATVSVNAGAGGTGGTASASRSGNNGAQGSSSSFGTISAGGGGGGGCEVLSSPNGTTCTTSESKGGVGTAAGSGGGTSNYYNAYNPGGAGAASNASFNSATINSQAGFSGGY